MSLTILAILNHARNEISLLQLYMYTRESRINAHLVKEGSFHINAKLVKKELKKGGQILKYIWTMVYKCETILNISIIQVFTEFFKGHFQKYISTESI